MLALCQRWRTIWLNLLSFWNRGKSPGLFVFLKANHSHLGKCWAQDAATVPLLNSQVVKAEGKENERLIIKFCFLWCRLVLPLAIVIYSKKYKQVIRVFSWIAEWWWVLPDLSPMLKQIKGCLSKTGCMGTYSRKQISQLWRSIMIG